MGHCNMERKNSQGDYGGKAWVFRFCVKSFGITEGHSKALEWNTVTQQATYLPQTSEVMGSSINLDLKWESYLLEPDALLSSIPSISHYNMICSVS